MAGILRLDGKGDGASLTEGRDCGDGCGQTFLANAQQGFAAHEDAIAIGVRYLTFCLEGNIAGAEKYLELFCTKSQTEKKYVQSWMPVVAASQSVKKKDKEKEILLSWVNVVDYE